MKISITPIDGFGKTATAIEIGQFQIDLDAASAKVRWILLDDAGNALINGSTEIKGDAYALWGDDDSYAIDLVLADAGVTQQID